MTESEYEYESELNGIDTAALYARHIECHCPCMHAGANDKINTVPQALSRTPAAHTSSAACAAACLADSAGCKMHHYHAEDGGRGHGSQTMSCTLYKDIPSMNKHDQRACAAIASGCINSTMFNFDAAANTNDGSCVLFRYGCT